MAKKTGSDYIPTEADLIHEKDMRDEWVKAHPPAFKTYLIKYKCFGNVVTDKKVSTTQAGAIETFMRECKLCGIIPYDVMCEEIK